MAKNFPTSQEPFPNKEPPMPDFMRRAHVNDTGRVPPEVATNLDEVEEATRQIAAEGAARYAPPSRRGEPPRTLRALTGLADALDHDLAQPPLHGVAVGTSDLKFHDLMTMAQGVIKKSDELKDIPDYVLAKALSAWGLEVRTTPPQKESAQTEAP